MRTAPVEEGPCSGAKDGSTNPKVFRGILLMFCAVALFACLDMLTKRLASAYSIPTILFFRFSGNLLLLLAIFGPTQRGQALRTRRMPVAVSRALCLVVSSFFVGLALQRMPVAESTSIVFLAPIIVLLLARPFLGEKIGGWGYIAAGFGFTGMILIARPGAGLDPLGVAYGGLAAILIAAYQMLSKVLSTEKTETLLLYVALLGSAVYGAVLPWGTKGPIPTALGGLLFLSLGLLAAAGHFLFTAAYRYAPASILAPIQYLQLLWAGLLGWFVFGHAPDRLSLAGMAILAGSGAIAVFQRNRQSFNMGDIDPELNTHRKIKGHGHV